MTLTPDALFLMEARSALRKLLPVLSTAEDGIISFNIYSLEGYLFAIHASPLEIDEDVWGHDLDKRLPDPCYEHELHADYILALYDEMEDALEQDQTFRIHTLPIPQTLPADACYEHPLWHWSTGFMCGLIVVKSALNSLPKQIRKHRGYKKLYDEYLKTIASCLVMLPATVRAPFPDEFNKISEQIGDPKVAIPLPALFDLILKQICQAAILASNRLGKLL